MRAAAFLVAAAVALAAVSAAPEATPDPRIGVAPDDLVAKHLTLPVEGVQPKDLRPDFYDARGERDTRPSTFPRPAANRCWPWKMAE